MSVCPSDVCLHTEREVRSDHKWSLEMHVNTKCEQAQVLQLSQHAPGDPGQLVVPYMDV